MTTPDQRAYLHVAITAIEHLAATQNEAITNAARAITRAPDIGDLVVASAAV